VNYPDLTDGALGFPAPSGEASYPQGDWGNPDPYLPLEHGLSAFMGALNR